MLDFNGDLPTLMSLEESHKLFHRVAATRGYDDLVLGEGTAALKRAKWALERSLEVKETRLPAFMHAKAER